MPVGGALAANVCQWQELPCCQGCGLRLDISVLRWFRDPLRPWSRLGLMGKRRSLDLGTEYLSITLLGLVLKSFSRILI